MTYNIDPDYVDVATRIQEFYAKYPDGRLVTTQHKVIEVGDKAFAACVVAAYRDTTDPHPCQGIAWEPIPGPTPFTKDSELMNAQTSAWGRAIVAVGIPSKKIASSDEVRARSGGNAAPPARSNGGETEEDWKKRNRKMRALISKLDKNEPRPDGTWTEYAKGWSETNFGKTSSKELTPVEHQALIDHLESLTVPFG